MVNFVALMVVNLALSFMLFAAFIFFGLREVDQRRWAPAFLATGLVQFITGLYMVFTFPLPGVYNQAFGEPSVILGALFIGLWYATANNTGLFPLAIIGFIAAIMPIVIGIQMLNLQLTQRPTEGAIAYILSGLAGLAVLPLYFLREEAWARALAALAAFGAGLAWLITAYTTVWEHLMG
jgi:putative membrane protein